MLQQLALIIPEAVSEQRGSSPPTNELCWQTRH